MPAKKYDVLIVGSGIAGLALALKLSSYAKVCVLTKSDPEDSNTYFAQGGIAAVVDSSDSFEKHVEDTCRTGDGLCKLPVVEQVIREAPSCISELSDWGVRFSRTSGKKFHLVREGGHSFARVVHSDDLTGKAVEAALLKKVKKENNIFLYDHYFAVEIITQHHLGEYVHRNTPGIRCYGVYACNEKTGKVEKFTAGVTVLATGGLGRVYANTTNPPIATGDGVAMAYRANVRIANMEFVQFHPTALYQPDVSHAFLISEALRGFGARLLTKSGRQFMHHYDKRGALASRDVVARAIDNEMKKSGDDHVLLDIRHRPRKEIKKYFPNIYSYCLRLGLDISRDPIPVVPAAHYSCGGILTDIYGRSSIENLYACGECACTGLHGANRLASNSLLEALVFARRTEAHISSSLSQARMQGPTIPPWNDSGTSYPDEWILIGHNLKEVQAIMSNYVGIVRSELRLERAEKRIRLIYEETEKFYRKTRISRRICELRNIITVAFLIIRSAQMRKESRGLHYMADNPEKNTEYAYDTVI